MELSMMFFALIVLLVIGVPIGYAIGSSGILYMLLSNPTFLLTFPQRVWSGTESFIIIAMPLFMLTGELMNHSGLTRRLIDFAMLLVHPFGGGLGEVNVVSSIIFGGISGSSVADTSARGSILIPDMIKKGYPKGFAALLRNYCGVYDLTAEAVLTKKKEYVVQALLSNPIVSVYRNIPELVEVMIQRQNQWLGYLQ